MGNETEEMIPDLHLEFSVDTKYDLAAMMSWGTNRSTVQRGYVNEVPVPFKVEKIDPEVTTATTSSPQSGGGVDPLILSRIKTEPVEVSNEKSGTSAEDFDSPLSPPSTSEPAGPPIVVTTEEGNLKKVKTEPSEKGRSSKAAPGNYYCHSCLKTFTCKSAWAIHSILYRNLSGCFPINHVTNEPPDNNNIEGQRANESNPSFENAKDGKFICPYCKFKSSYKHDVRQHVHARHKKLDLPCAFCPKKFTTILYLKKHLKYMHNPNPKMHQCTYPKCKYTTKDKNSLKIHNRIHGDMYHKCSSCNFKTKHPLKLKKHVERKHNVVKKKYKCDQCSYAGAELKYLLKHSATIHQKGPRDLFCSECNFKTDQKAYMITHIRRMHQKKEAKLSCSLCNYRTRDKAGLKMHTLRKHSNIAMNICVECDFTTYKKDLFYSHLNKHSGSPIFKCPECPFKGSTSNGFKDHIFRKHCKVWFYCDHCGHKSSSKYLIRNHILFKHSPNAAMFQCSQCCYKTKTQDLLSRHFNVKHNPDAIIYSCFHCSYTTKIKPKLSQHMQKKHDFIDKSKRKKVVLKK